MSVGNEQPRARVKARAYSLVFWLPRSHSYYWRLREAVRPSAPRVDAGDSQPAARLGSGQCARLSCCATAAAGRIHARLHGYTLFRFPLSPFKLGDPHPLFFARSHQAHHAFRSQHVLPPNTARDQAPSLVQPREHYQYSRYRKAGELRGFPGGLLDSGACHHGRMKLAQSLCRQIACALRDSSAPGADIEPKVFGAR